MTDAPERIYVDPDNIPDGFASKREIVSYVRADLAPAWQPIADAPDGQVMEFTNGHYLHMAKIVIFSGERWLQLFEQDIPWDEVTATHFRASTLPSPEGAADA